MSKTFYFAGELFSQKHLIGNALLAQSIYEVSDHHYLPILPQDLEFRDQSPHAIRDQDLLSLLECDLALFNFDGPELDSGTVVEFMFAKFADIPSVILRTDFREGGDQSGTGDPWNLMCSFYPRTEVIVDSCLQSSALSGHRRQALSQYDSSVLSANITAHKKAIKSTAKKITEAFSKVSQQPSILTPDNSAVIFNHLRKSINFSDETELIKQAFQAVLEKRTQSS